ncbi:MAG: thiamine-phosphate kinase [Candidatus Methanoliparum thermophilum]|uniref:Thiamine-monophosphate kinase n=1 Tax=Methanoliparum thermophilum TaxID=2491083 RepID=A0A520KRN9_METT2|nr:thiamine-phosphate kinase [Candidatus Methanoliparum sp. LAM-1]RZN64461.1 MAG: thiamine-phosphate kinase [Candidatus Methanoliparum thermophilum]BDC35951.1 thiamine-monophosphate kinase [Candidatus Methanoliparum sp. LAM-1]
MKITDIGERGLIDKIADKVCYKNRRVIQGIGDDAAVLSLGKKFLVATTDMLHKKADFPTILTPEDIGWMSVAVNLSDLAAMGAEPLCILMALGLEEDTSFDFFEGIVTGIFECCKKYSLDLVGGDIDKHFELTIVGTALGEAEKVVLQNGASEGDMLCIIGTLGGAAASINLINESAVVVDRLKDLMRAKISVKNPFVREGIILADFATSCIDTSDGFARSIHNIARKSNVGFLIDYDKIPIDPDLASYIDLDVLLYGGGDYGLLFTIKEEDLSEIKKIKELSGKIHVIGTATEEKEIILKNKGKKVTVEDKGYDHMVKT